jgi:hypothetical protein
MDHQRFSSQSSLVVLSAQDTLGPDADADADAVSVM